MPRKSSDQSDLLKVVESLSAEVASLKAQVAKLSKAPRGKAGADPRMDTVVEIVRLKSLVNRKSEDRKKDAQRIQELLGSL